MSNGKTKHCKRNKCRKEFSPVTPWQKFCSIGCGNIERQRRRRDEFRELKKASKEYEAAGTNRQ